MIFYYVIDTERVEAHRYPKYVTAFKATYGEGTQTMAQAKAAPTASVQVEYETQQLGPFLCWAVVLAHPQNK